MLKLNVIPPVNYSNSKANDGGYYSDVRNTDFGWVPLMFLQEKRIVFLLCI